MGATPAPADTLQGEVNPFGFRLAAVRPLLRFESVRVRVGLRCVGGCVWW